MAFTLDLCRDFLALKENSQGKEDNPEKLPEGAEPPGTPSREIAWPPVLPADAHKGSPSSRKPPSARKPTLPRKKEVLVEQPSRPASGLATSALIKGAAEANIELPDHKVPMVPGKSPRLWDVEAPLPSIQTQAGREYLMQTPAFVIGGHLMARREPLSVYQQIDELKGKLKAADRHQRSVIAEKVSVQDDLRRTLSALSTATEENKNLKSMCDQLTDQVLNMQRCSRDSRTAAQLSPNGAKNNSEQAVQQRMRWLEHELEQARREADRSRLRLNQAGIMHS